MGKDNVQKTLKEYFEDLYNVDRKEQFAVNMFGFDSAKRGTFLEGEPIRKDWSGDANGKLENAKGAGKKKKIDKEKSDRVDDLREWLEKHRFHIKKLEILMRMLNNESIDCDQVRYNGKYLF